MFKIKAADVAVRIDNKYEYIREMCREYITEEEADFSVSATDAEIMRENDGQPGDFPPHYLETLAVYRKIAEQLAGYNGFLMHGVLMRAEERGVLLCAESGTGKSTHAALWLKYLGDKCEIINGDKPLIRILDGAPYAYGTPWCGKEGINRNARVRLTDICFLERGKENSVCEEKRSEIIQKLLSSVHIPQSTGGALAVLDAADAAARKVRFWKIACNMDISAAETACKAILKSDEIK